jgi:hypothetical protein
MKKLFTIGALSLAAVSAFGQASGSSPGKSIWTKGKVDISGIVDGYATYNYNKPDSGFQAIRNFDTQSNRFALNMAKIQLESTSGPVGFRFDLGGGRAMNVLHATELRLGNSVMRHIPQAYVSFKPAAFKGVQIDFGKFYTSAGAELTENNLTWNYSRSLLYALGPYYHFGARVTAPVNKTWTTGFQLVNGWNNVDDLNRGKTLGFTNSFTFGKVSIANNYYVGPEKIGTTQGFRNFIDTVVSVKANDKTAFVFNYDIGREQLVDKTKGQFHGFSGAARFQATSKLAFSPRFDWYNDRNGIASGAAQRLTALTGTAEYRLNDWMISRFEWRRDTSTAPFFDRRDGVATARQQTTVLAGLIVYFGPKK